MLLKYSIFIGCRRISSISQRLFEESVWKGQGPRRPLHFWRSTNGFRTDRRAFLGVWRPRCCSWHGYHGQGYGERVPSGGGCDYPGNWRDHGKDPSWAVDSAILTELQIRNNGLAHLDALVILLKGQGVNNFASKYNSCIFVLYLSVHCPNLRHFLHNGQINNFCQFSTQSFVFKIF